MKTLFPSEDRIGPETRLVRWTECLNAPPRPRTDPHSIVVGVLPGEGVGPEVIGCALEVLHRVADVTGIKVEVRGGGLIGRNAEELCGEPLSAEVIRFCDSIFSRGGAILNGPGGGRYVYDLRKRFDLFFKISPLRIVNGLPDASRLRPAALRGLDILVVRENSGGVYQGAWSLNKEKGSGTPGIGDQDPSNNFSLTGALDSHSLVSAEHRFSYTSVQVERFLDAAARLAQSRTGKLAVVWKESGVPSISELWRACALRAAKRFDVHLTMVDIDLMAYRLIHDTAAFDIIATPNLFGDVLADLGAVLVGSRGLTYSGNWTARGDAVYQTNHGAAYDLAGSDRANPVGQILSMSMMLRETFGLSRQAEAIEEAVRSVWRDGWRTEDVAVPGARVIGTREMGQRIADKVGEVACRSRLAA